MENSALSVFITGGTNFVGRAVTRFLVAEGHAVTAMTVGTAGGNMVREDGGLPVYAAILFGLKQTGITIHKIQKGWDTGEIVAQLPKQ